MEACVKPLREIFSEGGVVHITSSISEAIGVFGSVSSILAFVLYLCDKYGIKK